MRLETRPPTSRARAQITIRDLVRNALRMRPDRIIVGEVRGGEALDMLQAMNTGHDGSLTTVHANTPRDALARLETMVLMAGMDLPVRAIREQIASAVRPDRPAEPPARRHAPASPSITEVTGMEGDTVAHAGHLLLRLQRRRGLQQSGSVASPPASPPPSPTAARITEWRSAASTSGCRGASDARAARSGSVLSQAAHRRLGVLARARGPAVGQAGLRPTRPSRCRSSAKRVETSSSCVPDPKRRTRHPQGPVSPRPSSSRLEVPSEATPWSGHAPRRPSSSSMSSGSTARPRLAAAKERPSTT